MFMPDSCCISLHSSARRLTVEFMPFVGSLIYVTNNSGLSTALGDTCLNTVPLLLRSFDYDFRKVNESCVQFIKECINLHIDTVHNSCNTPTGNGELKQITTVVFSIYA